MTIYRYLFLSILKSVGGVLCLGLSLKTLFDFIHKSSQSFAIHNPPPETVLRFYVYSIPDDVLLLLPISILLGSSFCLLVFARNNELLALQSNGVKPVWILAPVLFSGLLGGGLSIVLREYVIPTTRYQRDYTEKVIIQKSPEFFTPKNNWFYANDTFIYSSPARSGLVQIKVIGNASMLRLELPARGNIFGEYKAEKKQPLLEAPLIWSTCFQDGELMKNCSPAESSLASHKGHDIQFGSSITKGVSLRGYLSLSELYSTLKDGRFLGADSIRERVDLWFSIGLALCTSIIGLTSTLLISHSERQSKAIKHLIWILLAGTAFWVVNSVSRALAMRGEIAPELASMSGFIFLMIIITAFHRQGRAKLVK